MESKEKSNFLRLLKAWGPVCGWGFVIFMASTDMGSNTHTSRLLIPLLRWLIPGIRPGTLHTAQVVVRKCAHLSEYAIFGILIWRGWHLQQGAGWNWVWKEIPIIVAGCALYAATDEFHQSFVSTRDSNIHDVLIDSTGAIIGLIALWGAFQFSRRFRSKLQPVE